MIAFFFFFAEPRELKREALNTKFLVFDLIQLQIKPESTVLVADALST